MKLLKVGDDYVNPDSIIKITIEKKDYAKLHLSSGAIIPISKSSLEEMFAFLAAEILPVEKAEIPYLST